MSESLKSNTTLTELNLESEDKRKETQKTSTNNSLYSFLFASTGNNIGDTGATSMSESLKSNTTLTKLDLSGEYKRKTHKRNPPTIHSFSFPFTSQTIPLETQERHH